MKKPGEYLTLLHSLRREWKWLMGYVLRYRLQILLYIVMGIMGTAMGLGVSLAAKYLIDAVVGHADGEIWTWAALALGLSIFQIFMNAANSRIAAVVGTRISNEIRGSIYERILHCRWESIRGYHSGDLLNRLEGDAGAISGSIVSFIPSAFSRLTQFAGALGIVLYYDPTMAVFALVSAPVLLLMSRFSAKMMRKYNEESRQMNGRVLSYSTESIQNLQTLKAFDLTASYGENFKDLLGQYRELRLAQDRFHLTLTVIMSVLGLLVSFLCYGWGVFRLWQGAISFGTMTMFLSVSQKLTGAFAGLVALVPGAIQIATAAGRIMEITQLPTEEDPDGEAAEDLLPQAGSLGIQVEARNLSYTYADSDRPVLSRIGFYAGPGEAIAFVGSSGEGKTTILRLLLGLMKPESGTLTMGVPGGSTLEVSDSTRRFCAYVPQASAVFSGSIRDNLLSACPDAGEEQLRSALQAAEAWDFVKVLPKGMDTPIGERGYNFSEGQTQRICIARALLRRAPVLILDEATSALDAATEERVLHNIMHADYPRTCLLTTHRSRVLQYCSRVYRLDAGGTMHTA